MYEPEHCSRVDKSSSETKSSRTKPVSRDSTISLCLKKSLYAASCVFSIIFILKNGNYQGQTILTLDIAYQNVRQICRLNNDWLTLDTIVQSENQEQEEEEETENA